MRRAWLICAAVAASLALAAASCRQDVDLGVAPSSDAAHAEPADAGTG